MKKIIVLFIMTVESIFLILFIVLKNKNNIVRSQDVYNFKLDNGCKGQIFVDSTSAKQFCGLACLDKNNNYTNLIFDDQLCAINLQDNSIYASKYENENGKFVIYVNSFKGKNIIYAINYSDIPQIIKAEDFYSNGIIFQPEELDK